jgi:hypothetical protein
VSEYNSIEEAIRNGSDFYWDQEKLSQGRSGGTICPKCKKWTESPRKRKNPQPTWIDECEDCEIKDPFLRMWHEFNRSCDEDQRKLHNQWLAEARELAGGLEFLDDGHSTEKLKLYRLLMKVPFFEGM